jgi:hypothetical protein
MHGKNYWTTLKNSAAASWFVTLPSIGSGGVEKLLRFASGLLEAGEQENVYCIVQAGASEPYSEIHKYSYVEHLVEVMERTNILPLFSGEGRLIPTGNGQLQALSKVCYYDLSGSLVEAEIKDLGLLLKQLRPEKAEDSMGYMSHVAPITISGLTKIDVQNTRNNPVYISIKLETDIWFPWVVGFLEDCEPPLNLQDMFDNRELALQHTPRLNRFLSSVYDLVQELNGEWELGESDEECSFYERMRGIHSIELNPHND